MVLADWDAAAYARRSGLQRAMAAQVLALLRLEGTERVLDIGCGDGRVTAEVAARVPRGEVIGVDSSPDMIAFASSRFGPADGSNLRFQVADARSLPFREEFDLIVSLNALHWVPEQDAALRSIRRALKPDGLAQLRLVPDGKRKSLELVIEDTRRSPKWARYFQELRDPYLHLTPEQYAALAEKNGLRVRRIQTRTEAWDFKSRQAFFDFSSVMLVAWTRFLPEAERPALINDVLDRYRTIACDQPGEENVFKFYQMDITLAPG